MKYKLTLSFDGSAFSGWQVQNNAPTVQAELTRCVRIILGDTATVTGSSRTDSGVHALGFVCHIESEKSLPESSLLSALNHNLDTHIAVLDCVKAPDSFHARYSAVSKEYHYIIHNSEIHDPFLNSRVWHYPYPLDAVKMNESAAELLGEHRFTSFMAAGSKIVDTTRCVYKSEVIRDGKSLVFSVCANGFLYNMVRIMTGTLVDVCRGRLDVGVADIIKAEDRAAAGVTAPASGLYLYRVNY
ncbi:MAG: tRNA pseudouridine(38-40) synthase TruA [Clostridia bacterium]|nr:tRNA pseudouridine(38-40) synthase TruA [Clostridia bacterium]